MDRLTPERRSRNMARIGSRDTAPEMAVRQLLHRLGYRYRLYASYLPGRPDVVFTKRRRVVFVHGCYWHRHAGCRYAFTPKTHADFWLKKFAVNVDRDARVSRELAQSDWRALIIWSCETHDVNELSAKLIHFLGAPRCQGESSC